MRKALYGMVAYCFKRHMAVGGFSELALSSDDAFSQRMLREDVADKVINVMF